MNQKGFSLVTVLVLSLVIFLIGSTGLYIATTGVKMTKADMNLNLAEKAANAGLMDALDRINQAGTGGTTSEITGNIGVPTYKTLIEFGGRNLWFLSSEGKDRPSNNSSSVVKTALFQGFYGAGLYTVRGNVNATLGGARLSGCDVVDATDPNDDCLVPAFVAAGTVNATVPQNDCSTNSATNGTSTGLYGNPAIVNMDQGDLSRMFFRVQCFNKFGNTRCNTSLLDFFEFDYGWNRNGTPMDTSDDVKDMDFLQATNNLGIPIITIPAVTIPVLPILPVPLPPGTYCLHSGSTLNLQTQCTAFTDIVIASTVGNVTISGIRDIGTPTSPKPPVNIYTGGSSNKVKFDGAVNFNFSATNNPLSITVNNSANFTINSRVNGTEGNSLTGNNSFAVFTTRPTTLSNNSVFSVTTSAGTTLSDTNSNFTLNTTGSTSISSGSSLPDGRIYTTNASMTLNGTVSGSVTNPFRIVSTNRITAAAGANLSDGVIITGFQSIMDANINSATAPQYFDALGNITTNNVNIFARSLRFANSSTARILNSLIYVYAFACPNCPRTASDSSLVACNTTNNMWCGWYAGSNVSLNIGRDASGNAAPVLFISNNTTVRTINPSRTVYIWGVWYGEDVTYQSWYGASNVDIAGFLVRNFPPLLTLSINISSSGFRMNFDRGMIDTVSSRYRFFRRVQCIREPLTPRAQLIQTRMTNY